MRRALLALLFVACSIPDGEYFGRVPEPDPTHLTWCNTGEPEYLDPALASSTADVRIITELFDGLTTYDKNAAPAPSLATSWDVDSDFTRFTFHLRHDGRWSNGRPITAADFTYSLARLLHPLTASSNAEQVWWIKHGREYNAGSARLVLRDSGPWRAGEVVALVDDDPPTSSNDRRARDALSLRAAPAGDAPVWLTVDRGAPLTIVELGGPGCGTPRVPAACDWAYVFWPVDDGAYGWVPLAALDVPNDTVAYAVKGLDRELTATVAGRDVLHIPDLLGLSAPDPWTLVLETGGPTPYVLDTTTSRIMRPVPREAVSRWPRRWVRPEHIVTSGPFHLTAYRERDKLELAASPTFWDAARVRLKTVTITSMTDTSANLNVYYQGGCDALASNSIPASVLPVVAGETGSGAAARKDYIRAAQLGIYVYIINTKRWPNVHFRRALAQALDRSRLPGILKGGQIPARTYTPGRPIASLSDDELQLCGVTRDTPGVAMIVKTGELCYVSPLGPGYDEEGARRELELARREMGALPARLTIKFNAGFDTHKTIAEWVQNEWKRVLGLDVELESQEFKTFLKSTLSGEYDVARFGWTGNFNDPEAEFLPMFRCESPENRTFYCNPALERLFEEAKHEGDRRRRLELVRQAEALMVNDAPIIPMYVYTQHHLQKPYVRNLWVNLTDHQSLREVWIDPDWKAHQKP